MGKDIKLKENDFQNHSLKSCCYNWNKMAKLKDSLEEFFNRTSVHGFQYLSFDFNFCQKFFWVVFITLGFLGAGILVQQTIQDSYDNPVLTTIGSNSITKYPFPAITVDSGREFSKIILRK